MIPIPAGRFIRGSNKVDESGLARELGSGPWYKDESPQHQLELPLFYIDQYEVTNAEYKTFIDAEGWRPPPYFIDQDIPEGMELHPVSHVNWFEAERFCLWKGKRLPSEAEWEKASRGTDGREFPWGNDFDKQKFSIQGAALGQGGEQADVLPVGSFKASASPYGVMDMAGNVWEWTRDWYQAYPGSTYRNEAYGKKQKVFRGGAGSGVGHYALPLFYRSAYRSSAEPETAFADLGFRCALSPE